MGKFEGTMKPTETENWFKMPKSFIDTFSDMNASEMKVVIYTLRHTWGLSEYKNPKRISMDAFINGQKQKDGTRLDKGVGLSEQSICKALKDAEKHGHIVTVFDDFGKGRIRKSYCLNMKDSPPTKKVTPYQEFLDSPEWEAKREEVKARAFNVCERCGDSQATSYHCHHLTYEHGWDCDAMYLQWLCRPCHQFIHDKSDNDPMLVSETDLSEVW